MGSNDYAGQLQRAQEQLLDFLYFFEKLQEEIHFAQVKEAQGKVQQASEALFPKLSADLAALTPPDSLTNVHAKFSEAVQNFANACTMFLSGKGQQFGQAFLDARQSYCRGLSLLYEERAQHRVCKPMGVA
jgi:hypothetical protein